MLILILLCACIALIISMWLRVSEQMISMKEDLSNIKDKVDYTNDSTRDYYIWLIDRIDEVNKHLTTEIACLATKNNEDIKRVKEGSKNMMFLNLAMLHILSMKSRNLMMEKSFIDVKVMKVLDVLSLIMK